MATDHEDTRDRWLDQVFARGAEPPLLAPELEETLEGVCGLIAADASTESANPSFLGDLRAELLRRHRGRMPTAGARSVGFAAPQALPIGPARGRDRRFVALVAAVALLLAIAGTSLHWDRDGHPRVHVATAQASFIADPTPTVIATLTIALGESR